eukprot:TRINITY_DN9679_c0_g1_i1.p1 TRINITY_DN9679_c0_g1~~TRINITY_DN9679_c0_g1_i1.p1  ORF type:complete len:160 (-),score=13.75 TRINITY_DN9679_c0_g1_i1:34-513(-)
MNVEQSEARVTLQMLLSKILPRQYLKFSQHTNKIVVDTIPQITLYLKPLQNVLYPSLLAIYLIVSRVDFQLNLHGFFYRILLKNSFYYLTMSTEKGQDKREDITVDIPELRAITKEFLFYSIFFNYFNLFIYYSFKLGLFLLQEKNKKIKGVREVGGKK